MNFNSNITVLNKLTYSLQVGLILFAGYLYDYHPLACTMLTVSCVVYILILYIEHRGNQKARRELNERLPNYRETMSTEEVFKKVLEDPELMEMTFSTTVEAMWLYVYKKYVVYLQLVLVLVSLVDLIHS